LYDKNTVAIERPVHSNFSFWWSSNGGASFNSNCLLCSIQGSRFFMDWQYYRAL